MYPLVPPTMKSNTGALLQILTCSIMIKCIDSIEAIGTNGTVRVVAFLSLSLKHIQSLVACAGVIGQLEW